MLVRFKKMQKIQNRPPKFAMWSVYSTCIRLQYLPRVLTISVCIPKARAFKSGCMDLEEGANDTMPLEMITTKGRWHITEVFAPQLPTWAARCIPACPRRLKWRTPLRTEPCRFWICGRSRSSWGTGLSWWTCSCRETSSRWCRCSYETANEPDVTGALLVCHKPWMKYLKTVSVLGFKG